MLVNVVFAAKESGDVIKTGKDYYIVNETNNNNHFKIKVGTGVTHESNGKFIVTDTFVSDLDSLNPKFLKGYETGIDGQFLATQFVLRPDSTHFGQAGAQVRSGSGIYRRTAARYR